MSPTGTPDEPGETHDEIVAAYLADLRAELHALPAADRRQLVADIEQHIALARRDLRPGDETGLRIALDRLGDPAAIADAAIADAASAGGDIPATGGAAQARRDLWTVWLLLLGGFAFGVGWLVGVVLLWTSTTWNVRAKVASTLLVPGGLALPVALLGMPGSATACSASGGPGQPTVMHCTTSGWALPAWLGVLLLLVLLVAPVVTAVLLDRLRRERLVA